MRSCFVALVLLSACEPVPPESCVEVEADWVDQDEDGYVVADDCRDRNPEIHPLAFDTCDGRDNDCDGEIDEGYPDLDGDGEADCTPTERCNGVDDDGDLLIDEGYADFDGDGEADCLDRECDLAVVGPADVEIDETCSDPIIVVTDPWNVVKEWEYLSGMGSWTTPKVGRLEDTDGDGDVDIDDDPRVIIVIGSSFAAAELVVLDGPTGGVEWTFPNVGVFSGTALADVDSDGEPEVLVFNPAGQVLALSPRGTVEWTSAASNMDVHPMLTVADLDMDGNPEIITGAHILDGATGATEATLPLRTGIPYTSPTVGDIDLDGEQEILHGNMVLDSTGRIEWTMGVTGDYGHWTATVNVDTDPEAEIVAIGGGRIGVYEHDGTVIREVTTTDAARPGPICVADFDGDGVVELAWAENLADAHPV